MVHYPMFVSASLFFFKQKTSYELRISAWSPDVCSSDLLLARRLGHDLQTRLQRIVAVDQFQMRLAAVEQGGEQAAEMPVHRLERGEQALGSATRGVGEESVSTGSSRRPR